MLQIWLRELSRITHHKGLMFLIFIWPFIYGLLLALMYSNEVVSKMPITLIDLDKSQLSRTITRYIEASRSFEIVETSDNPLVAKDHILSDKRALVLIIPPHFQKNIKRGGQSELIAWINASNLLIANMNLAELKTISETISGGVKLKFLKKTGSSHEEAMNLIQGYKVESAKLFNPGLNYMNYLTPGLWAALLHQIFVLIGALSWIPEIERKRLDGLKKYSLKSLFWGKITFYTLISTLILELFFRVFYPFFEIPIQVPVYQVLTLSVLFAFTSIGLGTLISICSKSTVGAIKAVILITSPAFILSGFTWPQSAMPLHLRYLSELIPLTSYLEVFRKFYQEGGTFSHAQNSLLILTTLALVFVGLGWFLLPKSFKRWEKL